MHTGQQAILSSLLDRIQELDLATMQYAYTNKEKHMASPSYKTDKFELSKNTSKNSKAPNFIGEVKRNGHTEYISIWVTFDDVGGIRRVSGSLSQLSKASEEQMFERIFEGV